MTPEEEERMVSSTTFFLKAWALEHSPGMWIFVYDSMGFYTSGIILTGENDD